VIGELLWLGTKSFSYSFAVVFGVAIVVVIAYAQVTRWLHARRER